MSPKRVVRTVTKPIKKVGKGIEKTGKKVVKGVSNIAEEVFEETIEKPIKKVGVEVVDTVFGLDKQDRRGDSPLETPERSPEVVPDESATGTGRGRRQPTRSKRAGAAGTLLEGGGVLYD